MTVKLINYKTHRAALGMQLVFKNQRCSGKQLAPSALREGHLLRQEGRANSKVWFSRQTLSEGKKRPPQPSQW